MCLLALTKLMRCSGGPLNWPLLDIKPILSLASCHHLTLDILQTTTLKNKLIRRMCPDGRELSEQPADDAVHQILISDVCHQSVMLLVSIMNMFEDPKSYLLALLERICQRFPLPLPSPAAPPHTEWVSSCCTILWKTLALELKIKRFVIETLESKSRSLDT